MNILITGGTGFIGCALVKSLLDQNNTMGTNNNIIILSRSKAKISGPVRAIESINEIEGSEKINIIINLAGSPIDKKWTESYKKTLITSRVEITKSLISLIDSLEHKPDLLISASAVGYYGTQNSNYIDETSLYIDDFSHKLCAASELEAQKAEGLGVRTCISRLGVVLGKNGGALQKMLPLFRLAMGGKIGSGNQFFPWIHIDDVIGIFNFFISNIDQKGIYNLTSPHPVRNSEFTFELGKLLKRPTFLHLPSFAIQMIFGEMGENLLLNGSAVYPKRLLDNGYKFKFKTIDSALKNIITS